MTEENFGSVLLEQLPVDSGLVFIQPDGIVVVQLEYEDVVRFEEAFVDDVFIVRVETTLANIIDNEVKDGYPVGAVALLQLAELFEAQAKKLRMAYAGEIPL